MNTIARFASVLGLCAACAVPSQAEDIDLFLATPATNSGSLPNVLLMVDNTANWNSSFTNEMAALIGVFNGLNVNSDGSAKFNVGIMFFTETGGGNSNTDGGYVRAAVRPMSTANKALYSALIASFDRIADRSNGGKAGKTMAEAYNYFASAAPATGNSKVKTDYTGNTSGTAQQDAVNALAGNALASFAGSPYHGPTTSGCAKNFIIYISNGAAQDNASDTSTATTWLSTAGGSTTQISISPSGSATNVADEWARWMKRSSLGITVYTVDVDKVTNGQGPGWTAMLKSMAGQTSGKYFDVSSSTGAGAEISAALNQIFTEIQAVNSVFASVSLPASTNAQSTFLNQLFVGMFRPDADAYPRWYGNLKQYRLALVNGAIRLVDAGSADNLSATAGNAIQAINSNTGFITQCARSFWTPTSADTYWAYRQSFFDAEGSCLTVTGASASNYPDGPFVEKGAQAHKVRSNNPVSAARTMYTCSPTYASCTALTTFATSNAAITQAALGAGSAAETTNLINWARGADASGTDERVNGVGYTGTAGTSEMRATTHGDVVHSRPVALNYGTDASPEVVVFYSANDGALRAINGNRSASITRGAITKAAGEEFWSFIPPEFWTSIKRLMDNSTIVSFPGSVGGSPKPYGIDGQLTAFRGDFVQGASIITKGMLFGGMRRGGRSVYAFDVTNPAVPVLMWKFGCPNAANDTGCTTGWSGIGQTWSSAKVFTAANYNSVVGGTTVYTPLLMMGGGYDTCEDFDGGAGGANNNCDYTSGSYPDRGNHVYVLTASSGAILRTFDTLRGVTGAPIIVPDTATGLARYAYVTDLGGNIYRIAGPADAGNPGAFTEIGTNAASTWTMTRIAALGCDTPNVSCTSNRKFLFGADVAETGGGFVILVGSGDREKPLTYYAAATGVANKFYMVRDFPTSPTWLNESANCNGINVICPAVLTPITAVNVVPGSVNDKGWQLALPSGAQVVTQAVIVADTVTFSTHKAVADDSNACTTNLGDAQVFNVNYQDAQGTQVDIVGDGLPPSPVVGKVVLDDGTTTPFCIGCSGSSPLEGEEPPGSSTFEQPKGRSYWDIEQ